MSTIRLTKEFTFEMAHSLEGYDGACSQIHGHSYRLLVTVIGEPEGDPASPKFGMVMDFGELKRIVNSTVTDIYDHALLIRATERNAAMLGSLRTHYQRVMAIDFQPTCENLLSHFARDISGKLPRSVRLHSLRLHETATSFAEWFAAENR